MDLREGIDACYSFFDRVYSFRHHAVTFVDYDDIGVGDLQVCGGHMHLLMLCIVVLSLHRLLVQAQKDVLGINERDDTIEVNRATQAIVDPKEGSEIARISETRCFEEDVVEGASARHEGLDCIDAGVFDGTADAAIGQLEPFLRFLTVLGDCEGFFDIGGWMKECIRRG